MVNKLSYPAFEQLGPGKAFLLMPQTQLKGRYYTRGRIIRLDELGQTFVVGRIMRLWYKDGHKKHYASGRTVFHNASCARLYTRDA